MPDQYKKASVQETKAKEVFLKQKDAHNKNMSDIMYRVNLRDGEFMKVQSKLQVKNGRKTNIDPQGEFNYNKHHDLVKKLNKTPFAYTERKMNHFMPTSGELAAAELAT